MKYSNIFGKTKKESKEYDSKNAYLLTKAGFIEQTVSGVYKFLPLGIRVLRKIENIIRTEMDKIAQEMLLNVLSSKEVYVKTNRDKIDVLFEAKPANLDTDISYFLNPTHEDNITPLVKQYVRSYKDLPVCLYQIQWKFRSELRSKSGLLRCREFYMKDLYSFHKDEKDFYEYYEVVKNSYIKIFNKLGIGESTVIALASGGDFTQNYTHEFQVKCDSGEDLIFYDDINNIYYNKEVTPSKAPVVINSEEIMEYSEVYKPGIIGVEEIAKFLDIPVQKCVKTLLYISDGEPVAVAIRGDYEVNEIKLKKILSSKSIRLATAEEIKNITNTEIGYMGIIGLPKEVKLICDESIENLINFEIGINKTDYHAINVNWERDLKKPNKFYDIKVAKDGDLNPLTNKPYTTFRAVEVGNIFPLGTKFPDAFDFKYVDNNGSLQRIYMGSYGIGVSRLVGVIAELFSDENGLVWPIQVAPYHVHITSLNKSDDDEIINKAKKVYKFLQQNNIEVLLDDRSDTSAGEKLADADLIGIPYRITISQKNYNLEEIEVKLRKENVTKYMKLEDLVNEIRTNLSKFIE